jgi:hypothetical protein
VHNPKAKILFTRGFFAHCNTTDCAHGQYTKHYLIELGVVSEPAFLDIALSCFTFKDALLAKPILASAYITDAVITRASLSFEVKFAAV